MSFQFDQLTAGQSVPALSNAANFQQALQRQADFERPRYRRLWNYYRNPLIAGRSPGNDQGSTRPYRLGQEWGLPSRITGCFSTADVSTQQAVDGVARKEVVIENDIGWRIETAVDYLFGKAIEINSTAIDPARRDAISQLLGAILEHNGGIVFLQQLALSGAVYGFADVLVKFDSSALEESRDETKRLPQAEPVSSLDDLDAPGDGATAASLNRAAAATTAPHAMADDELARMARCIRLEIVEPTRALPLLAPDDYRNVQAYAQVYSITQTTSPGPRVAPLQGGWIERLMPRLFDATSNLFNPGANASDIQVIELIGATRWQRYENQKLVAQGENSLGVLPLVHIQNSALPFEYSGASDVEPLIPLQDELNTRLSDRAHRITMQSFKMYLGKGIENFGEMPVAPGRMWMTDNENAAVQEFGGDDGSPGEESHINEIREALDKASAVTPIAAGALKDRIGNLTSAAALRVTMQALLAKTERKRTLYGQGLSQMCALALAWLDRAGLFASDASERQITITWPNALPTDSSDRLADAEAKLRIGVPRDVVLRELGYANILPDKSANVAEHSET